MDLFATNLATAAAVATSLLALFAVVAAVVKAVRFLANLPHEIKTYFFRPRYILIPTPDEMARYSAQEFHAEREPSQDELREEWFGIWTRHYNEWRRRTNHRILLLGITFGFCYFLLCCALVYRMTPTEETVETTSVRALNIFAFLTVSYTIAGGYYIAKRLPFKQMMWRFWNCMR